MGIIPHRIELDVGLYVFCKLYYSLPISQNRSASLRRSRVTCVTCFSGEGHHCMLIELLGFVIGSFEDGSTSHCGLGRGNDGVILAGETE